MEKIFPLNLTAKAATVVTGNPVTTRLEGGVSNCFPGLEFDHRNLDRRFFPGLVFSFGDAGGAPLVAVDTSDPVRSEGGVSNCFPGLEFDHRNLDRRFFPGLVFSFGDAGGAPLVAVDTSDPDQIG